MNLSDPAVCLHWVTNLAAVGVLISTLETLAIRRQLGAQGYFAWEEIRGHSRITGGTGPVARVLDALLRYPNILLVLLARAVAAGLLLLYPTPQWSWAGGITIIFFSNILLFGLHRTRDTGAESMLKVVFGALFFARVVAADALAAQACIAFIALQACLAYGANGYHKLRRPEWRRGDAVPAIAQHPIYGFAPAARFLHRRPWLGVLLARATIAMEGLFPLALVAGNSGCWVFLGWGLVFHLCIAFFMGLNNFFWAFAATYPAVFYTASHAHTWLDAAAGWQGLPQLAAIPPTTLGVLALFAAWLLVSVGNLVYSTLSSRIPLLDTFLDTPTLTLFQTVPPNYQLFYRDRLADGGYGPWHPVVPAPPESRQPWQPVTPSWHRPWHSLVWNPSFWLPLHLWFGMRVIWLRQKRLSAEEVRQTVPYKQLRNYVLGLPRAPASRERQFTILRGSLRERTARPVLTSPIYPL